MKRIPFIFLGILAVASARPAAAQSAKPWIHVQIEEAKGSKVSVNLPLSLVQIALKAAPDPILTREHIHIGRHGADLKVADLRKMWAELKSAGDTDLVTVEDEGETVTIRRQGELVQVRVLNTSKKEVRVDVPVSLVDALLSSEGDTVNLDLAFAELAKRRGDIVNVQDGSDKVRIWIDERL